VGEERMSDQRPATRDPGEVQRPPLPLGLWIIAVLLAIGGVALVLTAIGIRESLLSGGLLTLEASPEGRAVVGIFAAAMIVAGIGMLMRNRSAWGLAMFLVMVGLAVNLFSYFTGDPNLIRLAVFVATAFYLNQRAVRDVFLGRRMAGSA
jgi:hypothetical protein